MSANGVMDKGFVTTSLDSVINWGAYRLHVADDFRAGVLCGGNDAGWRFTL